MVFPVVGGDGKPTGYDIDNSLRFNDTDSPKLTKTFGSAGSSVGLGFIDGTITIMGLNA